MEAIDGFFVEVLSSNLGLAINYVALRQINGCVGASVHWCDGTLRWCAVGARTSS